MPRWPKVITEGLTSSELLVDTCFDYLKTLTRIYNAVQLPLDVKTRKDCTLNHKIPIPIKLIKAG